MRRERPTGMDIALDEARAAAAAGEVPVGCAILRDGEVLARAHNRTLRDRDPTAHAEMLAIRAAARRLGSERLVTCDLYVTIEPCPMCAGAAVNARIPRVVYGAADPKAGAAGSVLDVLGEPRLNWQPEVAGGLLAAESAELLRRFFAVRR